MKTLPMILSIGIVTGCLMVLCFALTTGTLEIIKKTANATADPMADAASSMYFSLENVRYYNRMLAEEGEQGDDPCHSNQTDEIALIDVILQSERLIGECEFFADNIFIKKAHIASFACDQCSVNDTATTVSLRALDMFSEHTIMVCCNSICQEKPVPQICVKP